MKKLNCTALLTGFIFFAISVFAADVNWTSEITITPNINPNTINVSIPVTFQASFNVEGSGGIDNLRVIGGFIGGRNQYDRTWAHIDDGLTRTVNFTFTPLAVGTYTVYFQIDPDGTSSDSNRANNIKELIVIIKPLPNLVVESVRLESIDSIDGKTINAHFAGFFTCENSPTRNVKLRIGIVGGRVLYEKTENYCVQDVRFIKMIVAAVPRGWNKFYIEIDPDNVVKEGNEHDNIARSNVLVMP